MRVHVIGKAGTGKSTLISAMCGVMDREDVTYRLSGTRVFPVWAVVLAGAFAPFSVRRAWFLMHATRPGKKQYSLFDWLRELVIEQTRRHLWGKDEILLVDQGLANALRKYCEPISATRLRNVPVPDVVVYLDAPPADRAWRTLSRDKPVPEYEKLLAGDERRHEFARKTARQARRLFGRERAMELLHKRNQEVCVPPMSSEELETVMAEMEDKLGELAGAGINPSGVVKPPRWAWLQPALEACGVQWIEVNNPEGTDIQETARDVVRQLCEIRDRRLQLADGSRRG